MGQPTELPELFNDFVDGIRNVVDDAHSEAQTTEAVAGLLSGLLDEESFALPDAYTTPHADHYVMYPLHVDPAGRFSVASAVWNVGQSTPVHGHETWGVVGIYAGGENELRYAKPTRPNVPLEPLEPHLWNPGQVTVCCTVDDDIHQVACYGSTPCVGIHVYGADIGTLSRRSYDPACGGVSWFVSHWQQTGA